MKITIKEVENYHSALEPLIKSFEDYADKMFWEWTQEQWKQEMKK